MKTGISVYPGLDKDLNKTLEILKTAGENKISCLFTSLQIPEADVAALKKDWDTIILLAQKLNLEIISDISPITLKILGLKEFSLAAYKKLGITTLRLDDGYSTKEIADLSNNKEDITIQINASTVTASFLEELKKASANFNNLSALHNYYPREYTGISEEFLLTQNKLLHDYGIKVGAFIPNKNNRRLPLKAGLPTLESHRLFSVSLSSRHLAALGVDCIIIGDSYPSQEEIKELAAITDNCVTLKAKLLTKNKEVEKLLRTSFTTRSDESAMVVRANSRTIFKGLGSIAPENTAERNIGSVTLDNCDYGRYMGELEIIKVALPSDTRSNKVAEILAEDLFLLKYIKSNTNFKFIFI